ncbi:MAG: aminodeoxychorismate/anthranilate synthase component II [Bacteroidota bacterium]
MLICNIDNYDSFTYNLVQIVKKFPGISCEVRKNDCIDLIELSRYDKFIFSPGPGIPSEAGKMNKIIKRYCKTKSILGICLGHQAIAEVFGGTIYNLPKPLHGIKENILLTDASEYLFNGLPSEIEGGLYHSWAVEEASLPSSLKVTAKSKSGIIMGISHTEYDVKGLQFHPESVMTPYGEKIIENWLTHEM